MGSASTVRSLSPTPSTSLDANIKRLNRLVLEPPQEMEGAGDWNQNGHTPNSRPASVMGSTPLQLSSPQLPLGTLEELSTPQLQLSTLEERGPERRKAPLFDDHDDGVFDDDDFG